MKTMQEHAVLLGQFAPKNEAEFAAAMAAIEIKDGYAPTLPNKKFKTVEKWEKGYRCWRIHQEEFANARWFKLGNQHLRRGLYYRSAFNRYNGFSTTYLVMVENLEPGVDFQVGMRRVVSKPGNDGFAHYDVRITAIGVALPSGPWETTIYRSETVEKYVDQIQIVAAELSAGVYDLGRGEKNDPNVPTQHEMVHGLGLSPQLD